MLASRFQINKALLVSLLSLPAAVGEDFRSDRYRHWAPQKWLVFVTLSGAIGQGA